MTGGGVSVGVLDNLDGTRSAGYGGVGTCGSVWVCPQCAAKVAARRADELATVMAAVDAHGGSGVMVTLTMAHSARDRLGWSRAQRRQAARLDERARDRRLALERGDPIDQDQARADEAALVELAAASGCWEALGHGWERVTSGKRWVADQELHGGMLGWARVVEATHGANGWHLHVHALMCFAEDVEVTDVYPLAWRMFERWQRALQRRGFDASGDMGADGKVPGVDVRKAQLRDGDLADYFLKLSHEVTGGHRKEGRRPGGRTPMALLVEAVETFEVSAVARWRDWESASEGRRQLTWSGGSRDLRALAELGQEQTDEEIAAEELPADERLGLSPATWGWVRSEARETEVLDVTEDDGLAGLARWLDTHGQSYVAGAGLGWVECPEVPADVPVPRDEGMGLGWSQAPAAPRPWTWPDGTRRPPHRPAEWTDQAREVLAVQVPAGHAEDQDDDEAARYEREDRQVSARYAAWSGHRSRRTPRRTRRLLGAWFSDES